MNFRVKIQTPGWEVNHKVDSKREADSFIIKYLNRFGYKDFVGQIFAGTSRKAVETWSVDQEGILTVKK